MLKLTSFPSLLQIKPIRLARFNLMLAIWLGLVLNFSFYQNIHQLTPHSNFKAWALLATTVLVVIGFYYLVLQ